jgi:hypothetical protein
MSLDKCIPIPPITGPGCVSLPVSVDCDSGQIPVEICIPDPRDPDGPKCVNDNARRPWPTPPPAEIGCNPVSLQVTNTPAAEDDPDQTIRLEGGVSYISGDACLPQVNLNLVVPPNIASGGGSPNISGFGYTTYADCARVGPTQNDRYKTPQEFFAKATGAAAFVPKTLGEMGSNACEPLCDARSRYGAQVAKFNLIGPLLAEITGSVPQTYHNIAGRSIATGWSYAWTPSFCVTAANMCLPACFPASWANYNTSLPYTAAWNNKEMVYDKYLTPGISLEAQVKKGYKPVPVMNGTQVLMYGWIPWGVLEGESGPVPNYDACQCPMVWFFSEQVAFDGDCEEGVGTDAGLTSMLPTRSITSAGMFFGSPDNANRV